MSPSPRAGHGKVCRPHQFLLQVGAPLPGDSHVEVTGSNDALHPAAEGIINEREREVDRGRGVIFQKSLWVPGFKGAKLKKGAVAIIF